MSKVTSLNDLPAVRDYLARIGAEPRSLRTAVIREEHGKYWTDIAVIRFNKSGEVSSTVDAYLPTDKERDDITRAILAADWPEVKPLDNIVNAPAMIANADPKDIFIFRNEHNKIVFVQVRVERDSGKNYIPWTYWDDDQWRMCEPEGPLPLYNSERLRDAHTIFIHEGAKAAAAMQRMIDAQTTDQRAKLAAHPWGLELSNAVHVGWIGGALSPYRTDWSIIQKMGVKRAFIVGDNDTPGRAAVPAIAYHLRIPTFCIQFTDEFPSGFDLADPFPERMFGGAGGQRHYIGPSFRDVMHPATWATDLVPNQRGKATSVLRDCFKTFWAYVEEADIFVCTEMPEILRPATILNNMLAPFSHAAETTKLIVRAYQGRSARICYRPDQAGLMVTFRGSSAINLHVPSSIKPQPGNAAPWEEFLEYLFINEGERYQVKRWLATLICRPDIRMGYGMLLISEHQGVGKTTLGAHILAPLVGLHNVGYPGEQDIQSPFNDWVANKRLVIVSEIYSGSSWKAYHSLKAVITDRDITVNQKYMRPYTIENWCHVLASSNSMRALKMETDDRRWFYPEVTETPWSRAKFLEFREWLDNGGLSIIAHWAAGFNDYVMPAEHAPMTERKRDMIEGSLSEAQKEAAALADRAKSRPDPVVLAMHSVVKWVKASVDGRVFDTDYEIRRAMKNAGLRVHSERVKIAGRLQYVVYNEAMYQNLANISDAQEQREVLRDALINPKDVLEEAM